MLHFANSEAVLSPEGAAALRKMGEELKKYPDRYVLVVTGYASSTGTRAWNLKLSAMRAKAVGRALVASGIPAERIRTRGLGIANPLADNRTRAGQARNRRVEIEIIDHGMEVRVRETGLVDHALRPARRRRR